MTNGRDFLVAGGGIGGVAAALALARQGFAVRVLEQATELRELGAGIQLGPNVMRAFDRLGVRDAVMADVWEPGALEMRDALDGGTVTRMPLGAAFESHFGAPYAVTHRHDLLHTLLDAARAETLIRIEPGRHVEDWTEDADGVRVRLRDGETLAGGALIGADGLWSQVRGRLLGDGPPIISGHIAYRAVLAREDVPDDLWLPDVVLWAGPRTHLVHYPLRRGALFNLVAVFHSDKYVEGWNTEGDRDELMARFAGQRPEVMRLLERIEAWRMWVLCDREPVRTWSRGRVALLGDAAHPMLQYMAQGACMATEDAVRLADEVAATPDDLPAALHRYAEARYLRTAKVQVMARIYGEFYHASGVRAELRRQILGGRTTEAAYAGMDWLYGRDAPV